MYHLPADTENLADIIKKKTEHLKDVFPISDFDKIETLFDNSNASFPCIYLF